MAAPALAPLAPYRPPCSRRARLLAYLTQWPRVIELFWRSARLLGRARRLLSSRWLRPILWIALIGAALYGIHLVKPLSWLSFWSGLAVAIILAFVFAVWRARERVVIEPFIDYNKAAAGTENGGSQPIAPGLNDALVSELAALQELYRAVGERAEVDPAVGGGGSRPMDAGVAMQDSNPVNATLELHDVSEFLESASTGDATVSVGPFALPIGTVLAMFGRLARGPRITGGLQLVATPEEDSETPRGEIVLTAYYSGPDRRASWCIREPLPEYAASLLKADDAASIVQTAAVRGMVEELATRIFADLALQSTRSWRATRKLLEGLKQYRLAHESQQDQVLKLRRAARAFIEALADDVDVPLARYNLGVVYRELHDEASGENFAQAAENAFRRELQGKQPSWQTYYALAVVCYGDNRHADVSSLCDRVIELADGSARKAIAYDLKGLSDRLRPSVHPGLGLALAIESRRRAVAYSLLALLKAELTAKHLDTARRLAARCLLDLGIAFAYDAQAQDVESPAGRARRRSSYQQCRSLLCSAARLEDSFAPHFQLGKIAFEFDEPNVAVRELRAAMRIDPTSAACWAWLAKVNASLCAGARPTDAASASEWERRAWEAIRLARVNLNVDDLDAPEATIELAEAFDSLGQPEDAERSRMLLDAEQSIAFESDMDELTRQFEVAEDPWTRGKLASRLAALHQSAGVDDTANGDFGGAAQEHAASERFYLAAVDSFADYGEEIRRTGLRAMVAMALVYQELPQRALSEAQKAISINPMGWYERAVLGDIHRSIGDHESAIAAYEDALSWRPPNPSALHTSLADCYLTLADDSADAAERTELFRRGIGHLHDALDLLSLTDRVGRIAAHYWLGHAYTKTDEYERAVRHFRNALAVGPSRPVVQLMLGQGYVRMKGYVVAEEVLSDAIEAAEAVANDDVLRTIDGPDGGEWLAGELAAAAYRTRALSFIERDVRLDEARSHIKASDRLLAQLKDKASAADRASSLELEGRILIEEREYDEAIDTLNESVGLAADVEAYKHLARAYKAKAEASRGKTERRRAVEQARRAAGHARDLDRSDMFKESIASVVSELQALSPTAQTDPVEAAIEEPASEPAP